MHKTEFDAFSELLDGCYALLGRDKTLNGPAKAMFFRSLGAYALEAVRAGLDAHIKDPKRGRFPPTPADVIEQIEGLIADDGRPGAEEAWAMCCRASDESETVVWSAEMSLAFATAQALMQEGDSIGARMAFKEAYSRMVDDARRERRPVSWSVSLGHDASKRHAALVSAEARGYLGSDDVLRIAPPTTTPHETAALLIENANKGPDKETIRERIATLKAMLENRPTVAPEFATSERLTLAFRKCKAAQAVADYEQRNGDV